MTELTYTSKARADLDEIYLFIAADNPERAASHVKQIRDSCRTLCDMPYRGAPRDDIHAGLRILPLRKRNVVAYTVTDAGIKILRIFSGGQDYAVIMQDDPES